MEFRNRTFRGQLQQILFEEGYPDYALALNGFQKVLPITNGSDIGKTNGKTLYVSAKLTDAEKSIVTRHEILHVLLKHFKRAEKMARNIGQGIKAINQLAWNVAADYELSNYYSARDDKTMKQSAILSQGLSVTFNAEYSNKTAEEIYRKLEQDAQNQNKNQKDQEGEPIDNLFDGKPSDDLRDNLMDAVKNGFDLLSELEKQLAENGDICRMAGCGRSSEGIGIEAKPPKPVSDDLQLYYTLRSYFSKASKVDKKLSYRRPNKKYEGSGIIMRSRTSVPRESRTLAVYIDVSGSMSEAQVARALGICEKIEEMKNVKVIKKYFDTEIHDTFVSGGGTDYDIIVADCRENGYKSAAILTDDSPQTIQEYFIFDALWLIGVTENNGEYGMVETLNKEGGFRTKQFQFNLIPPIR